MTSILQRGDWIFDIMSLISELVHSKACKGDSGFFPEPLGGKAQVRKSHCDLYEQETYLC